MVEVCPLALVIGETLDGKYRITREIRRTSTGVVYEAEDRSHGRPVTVKTLLEATSGDGQLAARFRREARAAGALGDPHIPRVVDLGRTSKGLLYLVSEPLEGEPLAAMLSRTPQLPVPLAVSLMGQVLAGLATAHKSGLIHRDLNPESILVPKSQKQPEFLKILDFGVGRIVVTAGHRPGGPRTPGAPAGVLFGMPEYMSPELVRGLNTAADQRTDIYSAGAILYRMLCGVTPFQGADVPQLLRDILEGNCPQPTTIRRDIPAMVEAVIIRALEREPRKRFATAAAMRAELSGGAAPSTPALPPPKPAGEPFARDSDTVVDAPAPVVVPAAPSPEPPAHAPEVHVIPGPLREDGVAPRLAAAPPPLRLDMSSRAMALARDRGARTQALVRPRRRIPRWAIVAAAAMVVMVLVLIVRPERRPPAPPVATPPPREVVQSYFLRVSPEGATVTIDHLPVSARELPVDSGPPRAHLLRVAAPGHVTRSFTFTATAGKELVVRLGHTLPAPAASDPPPLPAELAAGEVDNARPAPEIERAFAMLGRYADCIAAVPRIDAALKLGASGIAEGAEFAPCRALAEIGAREPRFPSLYPAAAAYVAAVGKGEKTGTLGRLASRFHAEYLAERALWQWQELASIGQEEGRKAGWHLRRVALAARAWVRAGGSGPNNRGLVEAREKKLTASLQALADWVRSGQQDLGEIRGADDFLRSVRELLALARAGKRPNDPASYAACAKLLTDFDALVLD
jgi:hypothetical protein